MNRPIKLAAAILAAAIAAACSSTPVTLPYDAAKVAAASDAAPLVEVRSAADSREAGSHWLGAIRGGYGNPLKVLETPVPVSEVVKQAFADGLKARGLLAQSGAPYAMDLIVSRMDCSQYVRREAHATVQVLLVERASDKVVHQKTHQAEKVTGSMLSLDVGVFANVEDLRAVANHTLQQVVDEALGDAAFLALIRARK